MACLRQAARNQASYPPPTNAKNTAMKIPPGGESKLFSEAPSRAMSGYQAPFPATFTKLSWRNYLCTQYGKNPGRSRAARIFAKCHREPALISKWLCFEYIAAHEGHFPTVVYGIAVYCGAAAVWREASEWAAVSSIPPQREVAVSFAWWGAWIGSEQDGSGASA